MEKEFTVMIIPHTYENTTFKYSKVGSILNIEVDVLASIEKLGITMINKIDEIIESIKKGDMVIIMDDENRENEGDLIMGIQYVKSSDINFMASKGRGLICLTLTEEM